MRTPSTGSAGKQTSRDVETGDTTTTNDGNPFSDLQVRQRFIKKVYLIVAMQLGITFALCTFVMCG